MHERRHPAAPTELASSRSSLAPVRVSCSSMATCSPGREGPWLPVKRYYDYTVLSLLRLSSYAASLSKFCRSGHNLYCGSRQPKPDGGPLTGRLQRSCVDRTVLGGGAQRRHLYLTRTQSPWPLLPYLWDPASGSNRRASDTGFTGETLSLPRRASAVAYGILTRRLGVLSGEIIAFFGGLNQSRRWISLPSWGR